MTDNQRHSMKQFAATISIAIVQVMTVGLTGCTQEPIGSNTEAVQPVPVEALTTTKLQVETTQEQSSVDPIEGKGIEGKGILGTASDFLEQAKSGTGATAKGAQDWVQKKIGDAAAASGESAGDAMGWANDTFESLKESGMTNADNTSQWLTQDWKNMQSWEYKTVVLEVAGEDSADDQLNQLGAQGWECFHVQSRTFYFKKPADSYLRHLPFNDFIKLIPLLQQAK